MTARREARPLCWTCAKFMRCAKNEVLVVDRVRECRMYGDRYECEKCHASVVVGFGTALPDDLDNPRATHTMDIKETVP